MRARLLIGLAVLAVVALGVGVAVAATRPDEPTRYQRQLQAKVENRKGKPRKGRDPARRSQTSLGQAARKANDGVGLQGRKPARKVKLRKLRRKAADVLPGGLSNGCAAGYGTPGEQCLPARAPRDRRLTCAYVAKLFPGGIDVTGRDRLKLDSDRDGVACDPGDRGAR